MGLLVDRWIKLPKFPKSVVANQRLPAPCMDLHQLTFQTMESVCTLLLFALSCIGLPARECVCSSEQDGKEFGGTRCPDKRSKARQGGELKADEMTVKSSS